MNNTNIDHRGLTLLLNEANALSNKRDWTKHDERRNAFLLSAIAAVKNGASLADIDQARLNAEEIRQGFKPTILNPDSLTVEQRFRAQCFQKFVRETRDSKVGVPITPSSMGGNVGSFVPQEFFAGVFAALQTHDAVYDPGAVSYLATEHGRPVQVGFYGDIENVAEVVGENSDQSAHETDIASTGAVIIGAYSFRSPMFRASYEAFQDLEMSYGLMNLFEQFAADRIARGAARKLVNGSGMGEPLGLVPSLIAAAAPQVNATGSGNNEGLSQAFETSPIGSADLARMFYAVPEAYRMSPLCAWFMSDTTLSLLGQVVTKTGMPLVNFVVGAPYIYGKPVRVCPSLGSPEADTPNYPVVFGDGRYWMTRCAKNGAYVGIFKEAPGLVERGEVGFRMYARFDGALLWSDTGSPCPFALLKVSHS